MIRFRYQVAAATLFLLFASATLPSPLYELYRRDWGITPATISLIFAIYVSSLIPSLVLFGRISDVWGRRRTMLVGIAIAIIASLVFAYAPDVGWLIAARIVQGFSMGLATGAATAALVDWSPPAVRARSGVIATVAISGGSGFGPLVGGIFGQFAPWPHVLAYLVLALLLVGVGIALMALPSDAPALEPGVARPAPRALIGVPASMRGTFALAAAESFLGWASFALYLSLVPSYLATLLGVHNLLVGALVIACIQIAGIAASLRFGGLPIPTMIAVAMSALAIGLGLVVVAVPLHALALVAASALTVGVGGGLAFVAGLTLINRYSPQERRGEVMSAYYIANYLGFSIPSFIVGSAATAFGFFPAFCGAAVVIGTAAFTVASIALQKKVRPLEA